MNKTIASTRRSLRHFPSAPALGGKRTRSVLQITPTVLSRQLSTEFSPFLSIRPLSPATPELLLDEQASSEIADRLSHWTNWGFSLDSNGSFIPPSLPHHYDHLHQFSALMPLHQVGVLTALLTPIITQLENEAYPLPTRHSLSILPKELILLFNQISPLKLAPFIAKQGDMPSRIFPDGRPPILLTNGRLNHGSFGQISTAESDAIPIVVKKSYLHPRTATGGHHFQSTTPQKVLTELMITEPISHPNIIAPTVGYLCCSKKGPLKFYQPLPLGGTDIFELIQNGSWTALSLSDKVTACIDIATAVLYLHESGTLHCDIKTENTMRKPNGETFLCDFGHAQTSALPDPSFHGTPEFMAPEIILSGNTHSSPYSKASDTFSLAVLCIELLTEQHPFVSATSDVQEMYRLILSYSTTIARVQSLAAQFSESSSTYNFSRLPQLILELHQANSQRIHHPSNQAFTMMATHPRLTPLIPILTACLDSRPEKRPPVGELVAILREVHAALSS